MYIWLLILTKVPICNPSEKRRREVVGMAWGGCVCKRDRRQRLGEKQEGQQLRDTDSAWGRKA